MKESLLYRPAVGGFVEAMAQVQSFASKEHLSEYLRQLLSLDEVPDVKIKAYGFDVRNNWLTYLVMVRHPGINWYPIGYLNGSW